MRTRIYAHFLPIQAQEGQSISRRTSIVAKFLSGRNLRDFIESEQSANKRLFNMSATPADDAQTSPAWNCDRKYTTFF